MQIYLALILLVAMGTGCAPKNSCDYDLYGADEFVIDSYQIRKGKAAILEMQGVCLEDISEEAMCEYKDLIAEDDILNIVVYHPNRRDLMESFQFINGAVGGFKVRNGRVDLPDVPPVEVAGLSLDEAKEKLHKILNQEIKDIDVFVTYRDRLSRKVELTGLTGLSVLPVDGKIRLNEVIAHAHIAGDANLFMSYLLRNGIPQNIDFHKLLVEGDMSYNIVMRGGDKIYIAKPLDASVMIMGEVNAPRAIPLIYGYMSLREALVMAGGIPFTGDKRCIQVIRGNLQCPKIYVLSWQHIVHLPNDSLLLMPGDTVYVSPKPITEWNRFIEQLLPSYWGVQNVYNIYKLSSG
ncbi:putative polysaccharide export protein wza [Chlamydiales bacterium STE3]|nr:putative polysaccharide export protein wza [Chlamydiales bacterium STE3]